MQAWVETVGGDGRSALPVDDLDFSDVDDDEDEDDGDDDEDDGDGDSKSNDDEDDDDDDDDNAEHTGDWLSASGGAAGAGKKKRSDKRGQKGDQSATGASLNRATMPDSQADDSDESDDKMGRGIQHHSQSLCTAVTIVTCCACVIRHGCSRNALPLHSNGVLSEAHTQERNHGWRVA